MRGSPVVDDDTDVGQAARGWVRKLWFRIHAAGCSARRLIAVDRFSFDPVIANVIMSGIRGVESSRVLGFARVAIPGSAFPRLGSREAFAGLRATIARWGFALQGDASDASFDL